MNLASKRRQRTGWSGALATSALLSLCPTMSAPAADFAAAPRFLASNGAVVIMPEVRDLNCDDMNEVLRRLDEANYRGPARLSQDHPDWPIFQYEDRLSRAYYFGCVVARTKEANPEDAFSLGFEPKK